MRHWRFGLIGATATGLLLASLFPPYNFNWIAPLALVPLLWALAREASLLRSFCAGWLAGFLFWALVCHWIRDTLYAYGGLTGPLSWLALVLFALAKGAHLAAFSAAASLLLRQWWAVPAVAALWAGVERTHGPMGFAWLTLGNAGIGMGLPLRLAPVTGVYGLSFVFASVSCAIVMLLVRRDRRQLLWLAPLPALFLLPPVASAWRADRQAVSLQPSIGAREDWNEGEKDRAVRQLALLTLAEALDPAKVRPSLLLWPEAPAPFYYDLDPAFRQSMNDMARIASTPALVTGVAMTPEQEPLNSAFVIGGGGSPAGRYDKVFLVPFGEFVPPGFGWIEQVSKEAGAFRSGTKLPVFDLDGQRAGVFICYESAFPHLVRQFVAGGAQVLVNLSNDGYFGRSAARPQHLLLARMRAVENRRWLLRSTNDGITASISPDGQVRDAIPEFQRATARLGYALVSEQTLYSRYGDWFAWACLSAGFACCFARRRA